MMANISRLDIDSNSLHDVTPLAGLSSLEVLNLFDNQVVDVQALSTLSNLHTLNLARNGIKDINALAQIKSLEFLDLQENKIEYLPDNWLKGSLRLVHRKVNIVNSPGIYIYSNPLLYPPIDVIAQGMAAVRSYHQEVVGERRPLNEVRVILVGAGKAGKTSLVRRLLGEAFDAKEEQTPGVSIRDWDVMLPCAEQLTAHLWDFGGQEIMHATHQFFLSTRCLYLVVLDGRKDEQPHYWLKQVATFGQHAPVLVVLNKQDENPGHDVERATLRRQYPNIQGFFPLSCATDAGLEDLKTAIIHGLDGLDLRKTPFPDTWFAVKEHLRTMAEDFITMTAYRELCRDNHVHDPLAQKTLLNTLDALGITLYFEDFDVADTQVLKAGWLTQGVYRLLTATQVAENGGVLHVCEMEALLRPQKSEDPVYGRAQHRYLLGMMKKFQLCYLLDDQRFLIPDQLPQQEPAAVDVAAFEAAASIRYYLDFDFLPRSIMPRFLVQQHLDSVHPWRTGVELYDRVHDCRALVRADYGQQRITVAVQGEQARDYFATLRKTLLHQPGKLVITENIPLPDAPDQVVSYQQLVGLEAMGETHYVDGVTRQRYPIAHLLNGIERPEARRMAHDERHERFHIEVNPHIDFKPTLIQKTAAASKAEAAAQASATATAKNQNLIQIKNTLDLWREDIEDEVDDPALVEKLHKQLNRVSEAVAALEAAQTPAEAKANTKDLGRLKSFVRKLSDASTTVGKAVRAVESGVGYAQDIGRFYNGVAQWCGLPIVPTPLLGAKKEEEAR